MKSERTSEINWIIILGTVLILGVFLLTALAMIKLGAVESAVLAAISGCMSVSFCIKYSDEYKKLLLNEKGIACFTIIVSMAVLLWIARYISWNRLFSDTYRGVVMFLLVAMLSLYFATTLIVFGGEKRLHRIYFPIALIMGMVFMMMIPAYQVPDEDVHAGTAYKVSNSIMGIENINDSYNLKMREDDASYPKLRKKVTRKQREEVWSHLFEKTENTKIVKALFTSVNTWKLQYLIPALGISLGRVIGASGATVFFLGRLFNLLFFVCAITFAIKITPIGKNVMFMVALLPITLQQGMSFSYDVFLIVCAFLYIAEALHCSERDFSLKNWTGKGHLLLLIVSFVCLMMLKGHAYIPMAMLLLIVLVSHSKIDPRKIMKIIAGVIVVGAFMIGCTFVWCHFHPLSEPKNILGYVGKPSYTIQYILNHPGESISVFGNTLIVQTAHFWMSGIGNQLGWLNVPTNLITTLVFFPLLLTAPNLEYESTKTKITRERRELFLLISIGCFIFILLGMWTGWTAVGDGVIVGVQGRYFLPFMPLLLMSLTTKKIHIDQSLNKIVPSIIILLDIIAITSLM